MPSNFPSTYDTWADVANGSHDILAAHVNTGNNAAIAAQQKLGLDGDVQGSATVEGRLKELEAVGGGAYGTATASAGALTLPRDGEHIPITGTTTITSISATSNQGRGVTLEVQDACQVTDGGNLDLSGDFLGPGQLRLFCDGTDWHEIARSNPSASVTYATTAELADVAATESAGASDTVSRGDHVHRLADGAVSTATKLAANVVTAGKLADGAVDTTARLADGIVTSAKIADGTITDTDVATANKDGLAAVPSLRTLGTGALQAAAGDHGPHGAGTVDVQDEGGAATAADTLDFVGEGVSVAVAGGVATVTVPGGGSFARSLLFGR